MRTLALAFTLAFAVPAGAGDLPTRVGATQMLPSKLGASVVHDAGGQEVGDVEDVLLDENGRIVALVIGFGGVLGLAEKLVAVPWARVRVKRPGENTIRFDLSMTQAELKRAPAFSKPE